MSIQNIVKMQAKLKLKSKAKPLEPVLRIGKNGLTENVIKEIEKLLKKRKLIKIKILKSALQNKDKKEFVNNLVKKTNAELIESVGFVVVLSKTTHHR